MRAPLTALILLVAAFGAGCGGEDEPPKPTREEAAVLAAVKAATQSLEKGDYAKTCTYYTEQIVVQLIKDTNAKNCKGAWKIVGDTLRVTQKPEIRRAIADYGPESAEVKGNAATAKFGKPPEILKKLVPKAEGQTMRLQKIKGRWIIATLPRLG